MGPLRIPTYVLSTDNARQAPQVSIRTITASIYFEAFVEYPKVLLDTRTAQTTHVIRKDSYKSVFWLTYEYAL